MMMFKEIQKKVEERLQAIGDKKLFIVALDRDELVEAYLNTFNDPVERQYHNCNCCKSFLRQFGGVVTITDGVIETLWDFTIEGKYSEVPKVLQEIIRNATIKDRFYAEEVSLGTHHNYKVIDPDNSIRFEHFNGKVSSTNVCNNLRRNVSTDVDVLARALETISLDSLETVIDLIKQGSLYRGEEHLASVQAFYKMKKVYICIDSPQDKVIFCWEHHTKCISFRNTVIGTLLVDISEGMNLDTAVGRFEAKVAPSNYKRPTALVTKAMIDSAEKKIKELGYESSLHRRHASVDDIPVDKLLFVDRGISSTGLFDSLKEDVLVHPKSLSKVEEVSLDKFISDVIPTIEGLEILVQDKDKGNFMNLVTSEIPGTPNMFYWDNNISWSYSGEVADSMKERVKSAGGKVDGVLRFSIQWNESGNNNVDFDAHCIEPTGNKIYFRYKGVVHHSSGMLDVDIVDPKGEVAVENITWADKREMPEGNYEMFVHNFCNYTSAEGFSAEIEYNGEVFSYTYGSRVRGDAIVPVAEVCLKNGEFSVKDLIPSRNSITSIPIWGVSTNKYHKVSMVMLSPNHWESMVGNKHIFFILDKARCEEEPRGFYNEFLKQELADNRKVFEILGAKTKVAPSETQLAGLGYNSTTRGEIICKVKGKFDRVIKIKL